MTALFVALSIVLLIGLSGTAAADIRNLTSSADTQIAENDPTTNYGASTSSRTDGDMPDKSGKDVYSLLKWDLSSIPAGSKVDSATVTVNVTDSSTQNYGVYELKRPWVGSTATWQQAASGQSWEVAGAKGSLDRGNQVGTLSAPATGKRTFTISSSLVQRWLDDPGSNRGIIIANSSNYDGLVFSTREAGDASLRPSLSVTYAASTTPPPTNTCNKGEFLAEYRNEQMTFNTQPVLTRCEDAIDSDWGSGSPGSGVNADHFTTRWVGTFDFESSGYDFTATADDGVRLWVDGQLLIDQWKDQAATTYEATKTMTAGEHQVKVEYYENAGLAAAKVAWAKNASTTGATLYASPSGSGTTCSQASPCSLVGARDKARTINTTMGSDITVLLRGGTYRLETPFILDQRDSGTSGFDVVYKAYPGESPVLDGGRPIGPFGQYDAAKNIYRASVPSTFDTREVWVNGVRAQRARSSMNPGGFTETSAGFTTTNTQMANWRNRSDIEMVANAEWNQHRCSVASISGSTITMDQPCWQNVNDHSYEPANMGPPTYVENAYELLDSPGEWYLDKAADYLYYIPRSGENISSADVVAGGAERLLFIDGAAANDVRNIRFEGITFRHTGWTFPNSEYGFASGQGGTYDVAPVGGSAPRRMIPAAVFVEFARGIEFRRNSFEHLATTAIQMKDGIKGGVMVGNRIEDVGGGGLYLGNQDQPHPSSDYLVQNNQLNNNYIRRPGAQYAVAHGIWLAYTDTTYVQHNKIVNSPYTPISSGWGWGGPDPSATRNVNISYNLLDGYLQTMKDGGGIYTLGEHPNSTVTRNYMKGGANRFGGLYPDEGSEFITWRYNVIDGAYRWLHIHTGGICNNTITNNYSNVTAQLINNSCNTINSNVFVSVGGWPTEAQSVMNEAGLEASYQDIEP